ncbi:AAA family ATPase [Nocardia sp. R7R-8]|uniref:AAA family ATPase n=1 Tax=Nocardia sp. R7R-8 TaxID=3459304 RepID=UPI00403DA084
MRGNEQGGKYGDGELLRLIGTFNTKAEARTQVTLRRAGRSRRRPTSVEWFDSLVGWAFDDVPDEPSRGVRGDATALVAREVSKDRQGREIRSMLDEPDPGDGTGRHKLTKKLVRLCNEKGLTQAEALWVLEQHEPSVAKFGYDRLPEQVVVCWDGDTRPPAKPRRKTSVPHPADGLPEGGAAEYDPDKSLGEMLSALGARDIDDLMAEEFAELKWLLDELIPEGLTLIVAAPKVGKSYLVINVVVALAWSLGKALGGMVVGECGALIISVDDPSPRRMQKRLNEVTEAMELDFGDRQHPVMIVGEWPEIGDGGIELLDLYLTENPDCKFVAIDTLDQIRPASSRSSEPGKLDQEVMKQLKKLSDKHHAAIVVIHHDRKNKDSLDWMDGVSGHRKIVGGADTVLFLDKKRGTNQVKCYITGRDVEEREERFEIVFPLWRHEALAEIGDEKSVDDYVMEFMQTNRAGGLASDIVREYPHLKVGTVRASLSRLKDAKRLVQPGGNRKPYCLPLI